MTKQTSIKTRDHEIILKIVTAYKNFFEKIKKMEKSLEDMHAKHKKQN